MTEQISAEELAAIKLRCDASPIGWDSIIIRESVPRLIAAYEALMRRLQLAEAVCRLEIAWQKHELGDCAPESIQPALDKWREATK